jgi:hypothetical protein
VIRRPYIYIYSDDKESDEQGVINVASVRIDYNEALEKMIQVIPYSFFFDMYIILIYLYSEPMYLLFIPTTMPIPYNLERVRV